MRATNWPCLTGELKSTNSSLIWPETCVPTCTDVTGLRVPVAGDGRGDRPALDLDRTVVRENIVAHISQTRELARRFEGSGEQLLRQLVRSWWQHYGRTPAAGISKLIVAESGNFPEIARFFADEVIEPWHRLFGEVIAAGIGRGEFRPVDVEYFVHVVAAPLVMLTLWRHSFGACGARSLDDERYLAAALDTCLAALQPRATAAAPAGRRAMKR
jgi:TetR/AcrR family transcriptional regulator